MMNLKCSLLLWVIAVCIGLAHSSPLQETNAQRLARGLPPNPPKFLRDLLPTPALGARSPAPSPHPPVTLTGKLEVRSGGGTLGHVRNWATGGTISGINFLGADQDLLVTLTYNPSHPTEFDIVATNAKFPAPLNVGAGSSSVASVPTLAAGVKSSVGFTNVASTPPGSRPVIPPKTQAYVESAIWSIDPTTHQLKAQWINNDGSKPPTVLAYDIRANSLFFVGDINAWNANNDTPASAVNLFLVPA
ncbi:hypothetical protein M413DRAFT_442677 [Hebeloma cylindrosporum]|uniref:Uncharacterized protein n=1 Tax=Hebeloma cylindrosporum TaxID=76867 RepID=A0A0C2Y4F2_HEBCY|nr:hypothetical protein M413DRAFT_442677 [Hebeloma cylindrosporum h7]